MSATLLFDVFKNREFIISNKEAKITFINEGLLTVESQGRSSSGILLKLETIPGKLYEITAAAEIISSKTSQSAFLLIEDTLTNKKLVDREPHFISGKAMTEKTVRFTATSANTVIGLLFSKIAKRGPIGAKGAKPGSIEDSKSDIGPTDIMKISKLMIRLLDKPKVQPWLIPTQQVSNRLEGTSRYGCWG
jgi:hypothetical protein